MLPDPPLFLLLALMGGLAALDGTSLGQLMLSRPLVAGALAGWAAGAPVQGALVGALLEAFHLGVLPVGAARYPEGGPPAVAAGALFALGTHTAAELLVVLVFAFAWEWVSGTTLERMRHVNVRIAVPAEGESPTAATVTRRHLTSMGVDFARGAVLASLGMLILAWMLGSVPRPALPDRLLWTVIAAAVAAGAAASLRLFGTRRIPLFLLGAACGIAVLVLR